MSGQHVRIGVLGLVLGALLMAGCGDESNDNGTTIPTPSRTSTPRATSTLPEPVCTPAAGCTCIVPCICTCTSPTPTPGLS